MATMMTAVVLGFTWALLGGAAFYLVASASSRAFEAVRPRREAPASAS
jgi:hypothetical protein